MSTVILTYAFALSSPQLFCGLLTRFKSLTDCSSLVSASFNMRGEQIVWTPASALKYLIGTGVDVLIIGTLVFQMLEQVVTAEY